MRPRFIVDVNVGNLAPWLRALGYDTRFENPIDDTTLVQIAAAERRIIVTRDGGIMERRPVRRGEVTLCLVERREDFFEQLSEVVRAFDLDACLQFTRCLKCNTPIESVAADEARAHVPPRVALAFDRFWRCPSCRRYYWQGSHWERMKRVISAVVSK